MYIVVEFETFRLGQPGAYSLVGGRKCSGDQYVLVQTSNTGTVRVVFRVGT